MKTELCKWEDEREVSKEGKGMEKKEESRYDLVLDWRCDPVVEHFPGMHVVQNSNPSTKQTQSQT